MADVGPIGSPTPTKPRLCTCYCFVGWGGPIAAPDVDDAGMPISTIAPGPPIVETETTTGTTYWTATVNVKTHICNTTTVTATTADTPNLAHHRYTITRTRTLGAMTVTVFGRTFTIGPWLLFGQPIGAWGAWTAPVRVDGPANGAAAALASASPPMTPVCTTIGIACP